MAQNYGLSESEYELIKKQAARRMEMRKEFIKQKTNPFKGEAGYVFDPAIQKFTSMKVTQLDHFQPNKRTSVFGICAVVLPMLVYGYLIRNDRNTREQKIRNGEIKYKDRLFKLQ